MSHPTYRPELFELPDDVIYLDGNSLGPLPKSVPARVSDAVHTEWGQMLVRGWNKAGWFEMADRIAGKLAPLIGADPASVAVCDSTSINLFKVLSAALTLNPDRRVILSDKMNFPTDLYMAQGLVQFKGDGYEVKALPSDQVEDAIDNSVAVLMLTQVDYRTGARRDMKALTAKAHAAGALVIWDLAHSAGAFPVHLDECNADFAIGCGYKFLNGGPGAPAFCYVNGKHLRQVNPALSGWIGHKAPFDFSSDYEPADGIDRMKVGTPPILTMTATDTAMDIFADVDMDQLRSDSQMLVDHMIAEVEARCPDLTLATPRDADVRGSQVSFRHEHGYAIMQALIAQGVIGDFRAPDILRFGITPLYLSKDDITRGAEILERIMQDRLWDTPEFHTRAKVT